MQRKNSINLVLFITLLFTLLPITSALNINSVNEDLIKLNNHEQTNSIPVFEQDNDTLRNRPILAIEKSINGTPIQNEDNDIESYLLRPYQWVRVNISISNIGNESAYNLTIVDPSFSGWVMENLNLTTQRYIQVDVNATIFYFYYFQPKLEGNFTLQPTTVDYIDETGEEYFSSSQTFNFNVEAFEEEYEIKTDLWLNILYFCLGVTGILATIILIDRYAIQKVHLKRTKKRTLVVEKEKSKREEKRKIEKRR